MPPLSSSSSSDTKSATTVTNGGGAAASDDVVAVDDDSTIDYDDGGVSYRGTNNSYADKTNEILSWKPKTASTTVVTVTTKWKWDRTKMKSPPLRRNHHKICLTIAFVCIIFFLSIDEIISSTKTLSFRYSSTTTSTKDDAIQTFMEREEQEEKEEYHHKYHQQQIRRRQDRKGSRIEQQFAFKRNQEQQLKHQQSITALTKDSFSEVSNDDGDHNQNKDTTTTTMSTTKNNSNNDTGVTKTKQQQQQQPLSDSDSDSDDDSFFSACLLIMDDNHYLIEWLAYHYHVMPLRRLIVLSDPKSRTTPLPILQRWDGYDLNYTLWSFKDVFPTKKHNNDVPKPKLEQLEDDDDNNKVDPLTQYRQMHRGFFRKCLLTLKDEGRSWVLLTDVDEYTMFNEHVFDIDASTVDIDVHNGSGNINDKQHQYTKNLKLYTSVVNQTTTKSSSSSSLSLQMDDERHDTFSSLLFSSLLSKQISKQDSMERQTLRKQFYGEPGYFWNLVEKYSLRPPYMTHKQHLENDMKRSCVPLSRKHFGTIERHETYNNNTTAPTKNYNELSLALTMTIKNHTFNMSIFSTTNWKEYRKNHRGAGKTMIDVSKIPHDVIERKKKISTHRPIPDICTKQGMFLQPTDNIFVINHYPGTLEQMKFRKDDARGADKKKKDIVERSEAIDGDEQGDEDRKENSNDGTNGTSQPSTTTTTTTGDYRTDRYWKSKLLVGRVESTMIEQWLPGFVSNVGLDRALQLLADVGDTQKAADGAWV